MATTPPWRVAYAIEQGITRITRRCEIYEADGTTLWVPDPADATFNRLVDGSVSLDGNRDERRTLDLTLLNDDNLLRPNPQGGLWYDKIIKVFRGIKYDSWQTPPSIAIVEMPTASTYAYNFRNQLMGLGFKNVEVKTDALSMSDLADYDIIVSCSGNNVTAKSQLLKDAYAAGRAIFTLGNMNTATQIPFFTTVTASAPNLSWGISPPMSSAHPIVQTNLAMNPSGENTTANLIPNVNVTIATDVSWFEIGSVSTKATIVTAGAANVRMNGNGPSSRTPASKGDFLSSRVRIKAIRDCAVRMQIFEYAGATSLGNTLGPFVDILAGQEATLERMNVPVVGDGATGVYVYILIYDLNHLNPATLADYLQFDGWVIVDHGKIATTDVTLGPGWDGNTAATAAYTYSWTGTTHLSPSIKGANIRVDTPLSQSFNTESEMYSGTPIDWNYFTNPSVETVTTGWTGNTVAQFTLARQVVADAVEGTAVSRYTNVGAVTSGGIIAAMHTAGGVKAVPGQLIGDRIRVRLNPGHAPIPVQARIYPYLGAVAGAVLTTKNFTLTDQWQELDISGILPANQDGWTWRLYPVAPLTAWAVNDYVDCDAGQAFKDVDPGPNSYYSGATVDNFKYVYRWSGTANASASYRSAAAGLDPIAGTRPTVLDATATVISTWVSGTDPLGITASIAANDKGGRWFDLHLPRLGGYESQRLTRAGIYWLQNLEQITTYEIQMGEFVIDSISEDNFPNQVKVTARDYTKFCINSNFTQAVTFVAGTRLSDLVIALATNSGIKKINVPQFPDKLSSDISADKGTSRWEVMKNAAESCGCEIYFDEQGFLKMKKFDDPSVTPVDITFKTGPQGNLVNFSRSINDSRIYNHVAVYGNPPDGAENQLPFFGEAINTEPSSPTNVNRIGDRLFTFESNFFTSNQECIDLAILYLKINSLESYEFQFDSLVYPWLEVNRIAQIIDPAALTADPDRYLIDTINYPLGLGPMSLTGKRVTFVSDPGASARVIA